MFITHFYTNQPFADVADLTVTNELSTEKTRITLNLIQEIAI